jgi:putative Mg2+ transporter-C (MgtC) family protein
MEIFSIENGLVSNFLIVYLPILNKLLLAIFLGSAIGIERTLANKMAGMRTYAFVSLGSALFIIIGQIISSEYTGIVSLDPLMRLASSIIMGIGFLCGGLIIYHDNKLFGLTTAAGMWVATGIGIAVGFGLYMVAIFSTILTIFVFSTLWDVEQKVQKTFEGKYDNEDSNS